MLKDAVGCWLLQLLAPAALAGRVAAALAATAAAVVVAKVAAAVAALLHSYHKS